MGKEQGHFFGKATGIVICYYITCLSFPNDVSMAAYVGSHYRCAAGQGFQSYQTKALIVGGNDADVSSIVIVGQLLMLHQAGKGN
jgi:hypothetical protein